MLSMNVWSKSISQTINLLAIMELEYNIKIERAYETSEAYCDVSGSYGC